MASFCFACVLWMEDANKGDVVQQLQDDIEAQISDLQRMQEQKQQELEALDKEIADKENVLSSGHPFPLSLSLS